MLFVAYWEISNDADPREILEAGQSLVDSGMWPPEELTVIRWDMTADNWGITVMEADDPAVVKRAWEMWRAAVPGMLETGKTAPATTVEEGFEQTAAVLEGLADLR